MVVCSQNDRNDVVAKMNSFCHKFASIFHKLWTTALEASFGGSIYVEDKNRWQSFKSHDEIKEIIKNQCDNLLAIPFSIEFKFKMGMWLNDTFVYGRNNGICHE